MYRPDVIYRGPDGATSSLTDELTEKFGAPARPYEFVTGWKDPGNVSGHNPDSNGITHGVDIFTGNLRWTADHLAARGRAGDRRVFYAIYADQIASASTGWAFTGSGWGHWDHVHLSVWDGYWGGDCTLPASIYNDTSSWGITGTTTQGDKPTPIQEDTLSQAEVDQIKNHINSVMLGPYKWTDGTHKGGVRGDILTAVADVPRKTWATTISRLVGGTVRKITALQELADVNSKVLGLEPVIASIADQTDPARIAEMIPDDIAAQVMTALSERLAEGSK